jgi:chaperone BCS1
MTTNHRENLDPALIRPGRADMCFEYFNVSKKQAHQMFKVFYGVHPATESHSESLVPSHGSLTTEKKEECQLSATELDGLAGKFSEAIPEREFSGAWLQGKPLSIHEILTLTKLSIFRTVRRTHAVQTATKCSHSRYH